MKILQEAIEITQQAIEQTPSSEFSGRASSLNNLGNLLHRIFERTGEIHYLDEAIREAQEAVKLTQDNHPDLPGRLNNLGSKYSRRYERLRELTDLEESIHVTRRAVDSAVNHPLRVSFLSNLGNRLRNRYE